MLTHDAVIWQYVSCIVDAEHRAATISTLHALPLYHCAQLDVFFGPAIYVGATQRHHRQADARQPAAADRSATASRSFFAPPTVWIALLRSPLFDTTDLVEPAQGLLRRLDHAGGGDARDGAAAAAGAAVEPLRADRDRAAGDHARARRPAAQARLLRAAPCSTSRRASSTTRMRDVAPGEVGEIVHRSPHLMLGLFQRRRAHGRGLRGRLVPFGRSRDDRRGGLHHRRRPQEGHDQDRRRERRQPRGRGGDLPACRRCPRWRWSACRIRAGSRRWSRSSCRRRAQRSTEARCSPIAHAHLAAFKAPEARRLRRGAAQESERQAAEAPAARRACRGVGLRTEILAVGGCVWPPGAKTARSARPRSPCRRSAAPPARPARPRRAAWSPPAGSRRWPRAARRSALRASRPQRHRVGLALARHDQAHRAESGMAPADLGDLLGPHEHALDLGGLVGAAHPALDAGRARSPRRRGRRSRGGSGDNRRSSEVTTISPTSPSPPARRCRAARFPRCRSSLTDPRAAVRVGVS